MKTLKMILLSLGGFALAASPLHSFGDDSYVSVISISGYTEAAGYSAGSVLTNFPVLVRLSNGSPSGFSYSQMCSDGRDIRFTSSDGTVVYPHEIDTWDTEGESLIWVRVPEVKEGATFALHYGFPDAAAPSNSAAVWTGANNGYYAGVWHMSESGGMAFDSAKHDPHLPMDGRARSTGTATHSAAGAAMVSGEGAIGAGRTSAYQFWDIPSYDRFNIGSTFTVSMWVKAPTTNGRHFSRQASWGDQGGWGMVFDVNKPTVYNGGTKASSPVISTVSTEYLQLIAVFRKPIANSFATDFYTNGVRAATVNGGNVIDNDLAVAIGQGSGGNDLISGNAWYDELRILSKPVSADWAKAQYETASSASFLSLASVGTSDWEIPADVAPTVGPYSPGGGSIVWDSSVASGDWNVAANWVGGFIPGPGDAVTIGAAEVTVESSPAALASLTIADGGTLTFYNWETVVTAATVTVQSGGTIRTSGFIVDGAMSNRVNLVGTTLTVASGGRIRADGAGYEGQAGPAWALAKAWGCHGSRTGTSYYGGAYGGKQGYFGTGSQSQKTGPNLEPKPYGSAEWPIDPGSGGGCCARSGGGAIRLAFSGTVTIDGSISANASDTYKSASNWWGVNSSYGSGGGILILCQALAGAGTISADSVIYGSDKATTNYSGVNGGGASGGSGGRIAVHYDSTAQASTNCMVSFSARGGLSYTGSDTVEPSRPGGLGTLWFPDDQLLATIGTPGVTWAGVLTIPGKTEYAFPSGLTLANGSQLGFSEGVTNITVTGDVTSTGTCGLLNGLVMPTDATLTVSGNATFTGAGISMNGGLLSVGGDLALAASAGGKKRNGAKMTVQANGAIVSETNATAVVRVDGMYRIGANCTCYAKCFTSYGTTAYSYPFFSVKNLQIDSGGMINANEAGFKGAYNGGSTAGTGPGRGDWSVAHGGRGGRATAVSEADLNKLGKIYGSEQKPLEPGSASGPTSWLYDGWTGGGIVRMDVRNKAVVNGTISADANSVGTNPAGGSGGSVWLSAYKLAGTGSVTAKGGTGASGNAGGGGRIAIWCHMWLDETLKGNCSVAGGTHSKTYVVEPEPGTIYFGQLEPHGSVVLVR